MQQAIVGTALASSSGIVIGRVQKLVAGRKPIPERRLEAEEIKVEQQRLADAAARAIAALDEELNHLAELKNKEPMQILEAHRMMLQDPELIEKTQGMIAHQRMNAEWALRCQLDAIEAIFNRAEDEYLKSKKSDIEQVGNRMMQHLMGSISQVDIPADEMGTIAIGEDFSPSEIVSMWRLGLAGIICEQGGINAHSIIIARGIGMPALIGARDILEQVEDGDVLILDAERDCWSIHLSDEEIRKYKCFIAAMDVIYHDLETFSTRKSQSRNGYTGMKLMGNLELSEEAQLGMDVGIDGVGLFRTEFMFMQDDIKPSEERQYQTYAKVVKDMAGKEVTFRLLDIGGDKPAVFQRLMGIRYSGENPAMGIRGVRMLQQCPDLLDTQLRALARASQYGEIKILVPMVTTCQEMMDVRERLDACCEALNIYHKIALGCMIEVPAAVMIADELAKVSDFFSIGSNDLIQYSLAADRSDDAACRIYNPKHPAILALIKQTMRAARAANIPVTVCGELAANPAWTEAFMNMGMSGLSMSLNSVLMVRRNLSRLDYQPDIC